MSLVKQLIEANCVGDLALATGANRGFYDLFENNKHTLLVSIGDSWTYGAHLGKEYPDDPEQGRATHCYGYLLSTALNSDFLNLSIPGINNLWMIKRYQTICDLADQLPYDKIVVSIVITEYGREIGTDFDADPELNSLYCKCQTPKDMAQALATYMARVLSRTQHPKVTLVVGMNYVNNIFPGSFQNQILSRTWLECLINNKLDDECVALSHWAIDNFKKLPKEFNSNIDQLKFLDEVTKMIDQSHQRLNMLHDSPYTFKTQFGHPITQGHQIWADYVASQLHKFG